MFLSFIYNFWICNLSPLIAALRALCICIYLSTIFFCHFINVCVCVCAHINIYMLFFSSFQIDYGLLGGFPTVVMVHIVSVLLHNAPYRFSQVGRYLALSAEDSVFLGTFAFCASLLVLPYYISR